MHTFPIIRRQGNAVFTREPVLLTTDHLPDMARQEFKEEADINILLSRFGIQNTRPVTYGDYDYDIDLQTALSAIERAETGYYRLPPELRAKYPNWESVILALADGTKASEIRELLKQQEQPKQEKQNATRSDAESSGKGTVEQPATSEGRGAVPKRGDQGAT